MVQLQILTGARPGEVVITRPVDLDTTGKVWLYRPKTHKTGTVRDEAFRPRHRVNILCVLDRIVNRVHRLARFEELREIGNVGFIVVRLRLDVVAPRAVPVFVRCPAIPEVFLADRVDDIQQLRVKH